MLDRIFRRQKLPREFSLMRYRIRGTDAKAWFVYEQTAPAGWGGPQYDKYGPFETRFRAMLCAAKAARRNRRKLSDAMLQARKDK